MCCTCNAPFVNVFLHVGHAEEMPAHIKHDSPPSEARLVGDARRRHIPVHTLNYGCASDFCREQLQQRLYPGKCTSRGIGINFYPFGGYFKPVTLLSERLVGRTVY
jgi:hypothetical protein